MSAETLDELMKFQAGELALPQLEVCTEHILHGGLYLRTIRLAPLTRLVGALVRIQTTLIVNGKTRVFTGDGWIELEGYHIIPAQAGRKQIFETQEETSITMIFRTDAQSVEQAEEQFTSEHESLMSRNSSTDTVVITGA
jgi:hypothetical protein